MKKIIEKHVDTWRESGVDFYTNSPAAIIAINLIIQRTGALVLGMAVTGCVIYVSNNIRAEVRRRYNG